MPWKVETRWPLTFGGLGFIGGGGGVTLKPLFTRVLISLGLELFDQKVQGIQELVISM